MCGHRLKSSQEELSQGCKQLPKDVIRKIGNALRSVFLIAFFWNTIARAPEAILDLYPI